MFARKVFYLAGFDPRGARFYHQLLAEQASAAGVTVSARRRVEGDVAWDITDGASFTTAYRFLAWDDIVRAHWPKGPLAVARGTLGAYRGFLAHLDRKLAMKWPWGSRFTLFYPGATMVGVPLVVALVVAGVLALVVAFALPVGVPAAWRVAGVAGLTLAITAGVTVWLLHKMHSMWLLRFIIFNHLLAGRQTSSELDARLDTFADTIAAAIRAAPPGEEVLLVTHSNGSILAVPLMARLLARFGGTMPAHFALVTLGCCIPLLAAHRGAGWFHLLLDEVGQGDFRWVDIGSPTDGACAPLVAPLQGRAIERPAGLRQFSPRWFRYADPATYKARRADKYNTHFDYLRRMETPSPLDYLSLTCSAMPLDACVAAFEAENA